MKKIICLIACLLAANALSAQDTAAKKWDYGIQFGTSATFAGKYGSAFSTSVSPHFTWQASKRFRVNAGVSLINTTLFGYKPYYYGFETGASLNGNYTHALIYAEGEYLLGKDLLMSGSIYADVPLTGSNPDNPYSNSSFKGASLQLQYHIGRNATIQAGFNYIRSEGPYYYDPFHTSGSMFYDPFGTGYTNPFSR